MTIADDNPGTEDIAQETAVLDRLRALREARDAAQDALQRAIADQRQAGTDWQVIADVVSPCPAWCDRRCTADLDGSVSHHSPLWQIAGPIATDGETPVAWVAAAVHHKPGDVMPEPTFNVYSSPDGYELDADGVRMFAAVLLRQLERVTGPTQAAIRPAHLETVLRCYEPRG